MLGPHGGYDISYVPAWQSSESLVENIGSLSLYLSQGRHIQF